VTFDIERVRYRYTISNEKIIDIDEHSISKSSISNILFDIERPTLDIGVPRIQMDGLVSAMAWYQGITDMTPLEDDPQPLPLIQASP
jgi:hypothetical protein